MIRTYLDWLIAVPWGKRSDEATSTRSPPACRAGRRSRRPGRTSRTRVTEYLAGAPSLARGTAGIEADPKSGAILNADRTPGYRQDLDRRGRSPARRDVSFVRMSLGRSWRGRGPRSVATGRTYIGAAAGPPGPGLCATPGTMKPRDFLLDEVDKVGADWRGDPSAAAARGSSTPAQNPLLPRPLPRRRAGTSAR